MSIEQISAIAAAWLSGWLVDKKRYGPAVFAGLMALGLFMWVAR